MFTNSPLPTVPRRDRAGRLACHTGASAFRQVLALHATGVRAHPAAATAVTPGRDVAARRAQDVAELAQAIAARQLEVHYQPVVDMISGEVASVEALVRWRHPSRGVVLPDEFIPLAESSGLIAELTELVARTVVDQTTAWARAGRPLRCAINLSPSWLGDPRSSARLVALLRSHATAVTVEVTESVLCDDRAIAVLRELAGCGVAVAIDDFGTGYSCLAALRDLPASTLKLDRLFLRDLDRDDRASAVVGAIVVLAKALGLDVVAEGVETEAVATLLRAQGVRKAQGFLYARPMPVAELDAWRASRTPVPVAISRRDATARTRARRPSFA